jgi:hypothetical protein
MIRRLLKLAMTFDLVFLITIATAVNSGRQNEWSASMRAFDPGECAKTCWHGIQPGTTTFEQAEALMRADEKFRIRTEISDSPYVQPTVQLCWQLVSNPAWKGCASTAPGRVSRDSLIEVISFDYPDLRLGEAILIFGKPVGMRLIARIDTMDAIVYFNGNIEVGISPMDIALEGKSRSFDPKMRLSSLRYVSQVLQKCRIYPWPGFIRPPADSWRCQ